MFNIVLVEPEIPANTGNIARTCAVTGCKLHLVKPLGFSLDEKHLKRAGLDYWDLLYVKLYENLEEFLLCHENKRMFFVTTKGKCSYSEKEYLPDDFFLFGKETKGLPIKLLEKNKERCIKIPMINDKKARSLNLSNSVSIIIYEGLRQNDFLNMQ